MGDPISSLDLLAAGNSASDGDGSHLGTRLGFRIRPVELLVSCEIWLLQEFEHGNVVDVEERDRAISKEIMFLWATAPVLHVGY